MPRSAKIYVALISLVGTAVLGLALAQWRSDHLFQFACYLTLAILSSNLKVKLPGITSTM